MTQQQIDDCFHMLTQVRKINQIASIIEQFHKIERPQLSPIANLGQTQFTAVSYETTPFVPASDLLKSYQQTFSRVNQNQRITNTTNYKLKANFSQAAPKRNTLQNFHSVIKNDQAVIIEEREETILRQLQQGKIETTIPNMENTLFAHQLQNLQKKNIVMQNTVPLSQWKKLRAKLNAQTSLK